MRTFTEEDHLKWLDMLNRLVYKPSGKPFKSGFKTAVPRMIVKHDQTDHLAFLFDDESKVECFRCELFKHKEQR